MKVFFWQNMPSHIQMGTLDAFAKQWDGEVRGYWCDDIYPARRKLGWEPVKPVNFRDHYLSASSWKQEVEAGHRDHPDAIHLLSAIGAYPPVDLVARLEATRSTPRLGLIVDPAILLGWKGLLRPWKARWVYRPYLRKIGAVFAMGRQGCDYYRKAGFTDRQLFPFLYTNPYGMGPENQESSPVLRLIYVGQFHHRKGPDLMLRELLPLRDKDWTLSLFGCGPMEEELKCFVRRHGLSDKVIFRGVIPSSEVVNEMARHDLCLLPSRFDGWGISTNEAFQAGIPAIVSSAASSSDLIFPSGCGRVVDIFRFGDLGKAVQSYLDNLPRLGKEKIRARNFASRIQPETVAAYLRDCLLHTFFAQPVKPTPLWLHP